MVFLCLVAKSERPLAAVRVDAHRDDENLALRGDRTQEQDEERDVLMSAFPEVAQLRGSHHTASRIDGCRAGIRRSAPRRRGCATGTC